MIGATADEASFVLDGIAGNPAAFDRLVDHADTDGVSARVFALFHLPCLAFARRLRDFPDRRLGRFGAPKRWPTLAPMMGRPTDEDVTRQRRGDVLRLAASVRDGSLKPSSILRKLGAYRQQNRLYLGEHRLSRARDRRCSPCRSATIIGCNASDFLTSSASTPTRSCSEVPATTSSKLRQHNTGHDHQPPQHRSCKLRVHQFRTSGTAPRMLPILEIAWAWRFISSQTVGCGVASKSRRIQSSSAAEAPASRSLRYASSRE
ncbi:MAG: Tn3 family transposase [Boseongicola sp. SB0677_bin_26]|nr:Tn3 family transposase [Boseongicola sp. SB0665_bin_10]MYG25929.1 Tn3 family transposase [Boseongicola sp. SB0677_bin_26]